MREYDFPLIEVHKIKPEDYQTDLREFFGAMNCREEAPYYWKNETRRVG